MAHGARAVPVSSAEVLGAVSAWSQANGQAFSDSGPGMPVSASAFLDADGSTVLCWIVSMSNGGAVVASPDTDLDLVVAVVENYGGSFPEGHPLPSILRRDMRNRLAKLGLGRTKSGAGLLSAKPVAESMPEDVKASVKEANARWAKYGVGSGGAKLSGEELDGGDSSPYVRRIVDGFESGGRYTHWNQGFVGGNYCYNLYTPHHAVCGCVATAGSAVLQFFNCTNDPGIVAGAGCTWNKKPWTCSTLPGDTDWSILPKSYGGAKEVDDVLDDAGREVLGRVAYNMGVLVSMNWDSDGPGTESGAAVSKLADAFKAYGFTTARSVFYDTSKDADPGQFVKTIYAQNWCGAPVVMGIATEGSPGGHAVVAVGYARDGDGDEFCRVFMGWAGSADAWYKFPKVASYNIIDETITMIGYQDDAVVPVYGEANVPGVELTLPGYITNGVPVKVSVNENGYFGIRVPTTLGDKHVLYEPRGKSADIDPFDADTLANESSPRQNLDAATPDEILFSILNASVKYTMESADAVAEQEGKALLMVSGLSGSPRTKALMEYIYWLDDTTDFSNKFVLVFNSIKASDPNRPDGDPSIGVFNPVTFTASDRWQESNGRLSYTNFIESVDRTTGEISYCFSETNSVAVTNILPSLLYTGYDTFLRQYAAITLTVTGVNLRYPLEGEDPNDPFEVGTVLPGYGSYSGVFTNGETIAMSAPGTYTNLEEGVIYSCVGWTTNDLFKLVDGLDGPEWQRQPYNFGADVDLRLFAGDNVKFSWVWSVSHYHVTAAPNLDYSVSGSEDAVNPQSAWVVAGGRHTVGAVPAIGKYGLDYWSVKSAAGVDLIDDQDALVVENGSAVSFTVNAPMVVKAVYRQRATAQPMKTYSLSLAATPAGLEDVIEPFQPGLSWGDNVVTDEVVQVMVSVGSMVADSTGGVWCCTSVALTGALYYQISSTQYRFYGPEYPIAISTSWAYVDPTPPPPVPDPIAFSSIVRETPGYCTITITNGVAGCWYWLYATGNLAAISGDSSGWTAGLATTVEANPQQAVSDGPVVFHASETAEPLFWRATATSTEVGD